MRKKLLSVVVFIFLSSYLFAAWTQGFYVDEFDDPTGEYFAYTIVDGTYSNSYTVKGKTEVRVIASVLDAEVPRISLEFEIHEDTYNYPVKNFDYKDSVTAQYKVKFESGKIYDFEITQSDYSPWYSVPPINANVLAEELLSNHSMKCVIYVDDTKYNVNLDAEGFKEVVQTIYDGLKPQFDQWAREPESEIMIDFMKEYLPESDIADYNLEFYSLRDFDDKIGLVCIYFDIQNYIDYGYPDFRAWVTLLDSYDEIDLGGDQQFVKSITFTNDYDNVDIAGTEGDYFVEWDFNKTKFDTLCEMLTKSPNLSISLTTEDGHSTSFFMDCFYLDWEFDAMIERFE